MEKYTHRLNIQLAQFVSGIFEILKILNPSQIHLMVIKKNERMCKQKKKKNFKVHSFPAILANQLIANYSY